MEQRDASGIPAPPKERQKLRQDPHMTIENLPCLLYFPWENCGKANVDCDFPVLFFEIAEGLLEFVLQLDPSFQEFGPSNIHISCDMFRERL